MTLMWTADESTYQQAWLDMLDYYLNQAERHGLANSSRLSKPLECRWQHLAADLQTQKSAADFGIGSISRHQRDGHITIRGIFNELTYGGMPTEAILRSMYYTGKIERQYGLSFPLVMANENQTQPYGLGMLWAGSGARYSWKGVCNYNTRIIEAVRRDACYEIYWWTGLDGSKILLKWNSLDGYYSIGGYAEVLTRPPS